MNYYPFHIGDYASATRHLSWDEDAAYRRLLDVYYTTEKPLPTDLRSVCRLVMATTEAQREAVAIVLEEFFERTADGWVNCRADREIEAMSTKRQKARESALIGVEARTRRNAGLRAERMADARAKATHTDEQWARMVALCKGCVRCGASGPVEKDHITPIYQGGSDGIENLQPLCKTCNTSKGPEAVDHRPESVRSAFAAEIRANAEKAAANAQLPTPTPTPTPVEKKERVRASAALRPDGVPESVWLDFMAQRKAHRAPLTQTALDGIARQAGIAGMTLAEALAHCCSKGWRSFEAAWVRPDGTAQPRASPAAAKRTAFMDSIYGRTQQPPENVIDADFRTVTPRLG